MKSHPHQSLKTHLSEACINSGFIIKKHPNFLFENKDITEKILSLASLCHDFGKSTGFFQKYMEQIASGITVKSGPIERHSLISAIVGYNLAKKVLQVNNIEPYPTAFYLFSAIKRHHGNLGDFSKETDNINEEDISLLHKQIASIILVDLNKLFKELINFFPEEIVNFLPALDELYSWVNTFNDELRTIRFKQYKNFYKKNNNETENLSDYFKFVFMYSIVVESDKSQVVIGKIKSRDNSVPVDLIKKYKYLKKWKKTKLNDLRETAFKEIEANIDKAKEGSIFEITLPTGLGKTLAAYNFALKLKDIRFKERGIHPKIIYSLPFLSVIDQNYLVLEDIFNKLQIKYDHNTLLKHHHLTEAKYVSIDEEETEYDSNISGFLIEGWYSDIVVTTFNQLFETIITYKNSTSRRFHKLSNSIILIDEVQALPVKYWELLRSLLLFLGKKMNTDIVLITATQPKILSLQDGLVPLCESHKYFNHKSLDRIEMKVDLERKTIDEFIEQIYIDNENKYLFILNTIGSAKLLYEKLSLKLDEPIGFLSTHIIMKHRMERIREIKKDLSQYRVVVSTQLVEAGVDIDFNIVYRDIAPMDSINQAAGRCNRNGKEKGLINIMHLWNGKRSFASMVYSDIVRLKATEEILLSHIKHHDTIGEKDLLNLIERYFVEVKTKINRRESFDILEAISNLCFFSDDSEKPAISNFKLIDDHYDRVSVFIEIDSDAAKIWQQYNSIFQIEDFYKRSDEFNKIKGSFYDYVVSVPKSYTLPVELNCHYYVSNNMLDTYYDIVLGYKSSIDLLIW